MLFMENSFFFIIILLDLLSCGKAHEPTSFSDVMFPDSYLHAMTSKYQFLQEKLSVIEEKKK